MAKKVRAIFVLEIIGRPAEHLIESLNKFIDDIDKEKGVKVVKRDIKEPIEMKSPENSSDQNKFYTTFAEVEIEVEQIAHILGLMFRYMPANIEIIEPESIELRNNLLNDLLNELTRRLHAYDEVARVLQMQNAQMQKKLGSLTKSEVSSTKKDERSELIPSKPAQAPIIANENGPRGVSTDKGGKTSGEIPIVNAETEKENIKKEKPKRTRKSKKKE